jgi:hypothetical protein
MTYSFSFLGFDNICNPIYDVDSPYNYNYGSGKLFNWDGDLDFYEHLWAVLKVDSRIFGYSEMRYVFPELAGWFKYLDSVQLLFSLGDDREAEQLFIDRFERCFVERSGF